MNKADMYTLRKHAARVMATCNMKLPQNEGTDVDHAIASTASWDVMNWEGGGHCVFMESMAVRKTKTNGGKCIRCYARWWDGGSGGHLHHDSGGNSECYSPYLSGAYHQVGSEDNFGQYGSVASDFACSSSSSSTTQWWFQDILFAELGRTQDKPGKSCKAIHGAARDEDRQAPDGYYWLTLDGQIDAKRFFCKMEKNWHTDSAEKTYTRVASYRKATVQRSHAMLQNNPRTADPLYDGRETRAHMLLLQEMGDRFVVVCNGDFSAMGDHARATWKNFDFLNFRGGGTCRMHEALAVRNNRRNGNACTDCNHRWWQQNNDALHMDSSAWCSL
jgi:hypothetical protein